ncbi:MAG: sulfatase [Bryobacteraceae bacterium]
MSFTRRHFLLSSALPLVAQKTPAPPPRPNILVIMADDLASWMLGCYGNTEFRTPNIDRLARSGMRFINSYVCTPVCSPSRATFFTGRVPSQHGVHDFLTERPIENPPQGQAEQPPSFGQEVMVSDVLASNGYNCGYVGKWHMGEDRKPGHGYNYTYTMLGGSRSYNDPEMYLNGEAVQEKGYLTELMTRRACEFLDAQKPDRPFFLVASYLNPHTPYDGHPQKYYDIYKDARFEKVGYESPAPNALREKQFLDDPVPHLRMCAASVTALDDQIPALLAKLHERGLWDNTIIVFTSDNGYLLGRHGLWSKGLASDPINMYEEVMQVPMIWSWPGKVPVESTRPELVSFYDFLPTLCDAAGVAAPSRKLCGRSYLQLVMNRPFPRNRQWPNIVFGSFRNTEMARDIRYKLVLRNKGAGPNELYDLAEDPGERENVFENPHFVTVRDRLRGELDRWRSRTA